MIPSAIISANRLIILMLPPARYKTARVAINDTGIPTATQNATRVDKKAYRISNTSSKPPAPFFTNSMMRCLINCQRSLKTFTLTPGGNVGVTSSSHCCKISADFNESPFSLRRNTRTAAFLSSSEIVSEPLLIRRSICAISPSLIRFAPSPTNATSTKLFAVRRWFKLRNSRVPSFSPTSPAGKSWLT